jgi:hypothetical protein
MKNIANGNGFVYQQNGENVEGFTSLLWTLIGSLLYKFTEHIHVVLIIFNLALLFCMLRLYYIFFRKISENYYLYFFSFTVILIVSSGFLSWNIFSLLETCLWTVLINLIVIDILNTIYFQKKQKNIFLILVTLLIFTRPEALLLSVYFVICKTYFLCRDNKNQKILQTIVSLILPVIFAIATLYSWRFYNFKVLFPNTYYAKVSGSIWQKIDFGISYNILFFKENPLFFLILVISTAYFIYCFFLKKISLSKIGGKFFLFSTIIVSLCIPLMVGGDHFGLYRFMQPYIPLYILIIILIIDSLNFKNYIPVTIIFAFVVFHILSSRYNIFKIILKSEKNFPSRVEWDIAKSNRYQAKEINGFFPSDKLPSLGLLAAGSYAYYYNGSSIDLLGLNNVKMAHALKNPNGPKNHASFNKAVFYQQQPDIIVANIEFKAHKDLSSLRFINLGSWESKLLDNIQDDEKFKELYANCVILNKNKNLVFKAYIKRQYISRLLLIDDSNYYILQK